MISNNVVLVLGAGASNPYGFPVGNELVNEAIHPLKSIEGSLIGEMRERSIDPEKLAHFRSALEASLTTSIDAFLETRKEYEELGKMIISYQLMRREDPKELFRLENDPSQKETWYGTLFRMMHTPESKDFGNNQLNIITYNYDRSLEYCLLRVLEATYGLDWNECGKLLFDNIQIIHLHGTLGELHGKDEDIREYKTDLSNKNLELAVRKIQIVHDVDTSESQFEKAHEVLQKADKVMFLGFGYYSKNVERLRLNEVCPQAQLWGTCKGFTEPEHQLHIRSQIPTLRYGITCVDQSVNDFLRYHPQLFVKPSHGDDK